MPFRYALLGGLLLLAGCGEQFCGFGVVGDCDKMFKDGNTHSGTGTGTGTGGELIVRPAEGQGEVYVGRTADVFTQGGTGKVNMLTPTDPSDCGSIDTSRPKWIFTAGQIAGVCKIRFRDSGNPVQEKTFQITVKATGT